MRRCKSQVTLRKDDRQASGTEVLQLLSLVVYPGESVVVEAVGPDAAAVLDAAGVDADTLAREYQRWRVGKPGLFSDDRFRSF